MSDVRPADRERVDPRAELADHTMYELLGGEHAVRALVDRFYEIMDGDESFRAIREMHADDLAPMRLSLFEYLSGWLGGPSLYVERHGSPCIAGAHAPFTIDREAHDQWLECMRRAMADVGIADRYRELLFPAFGRLAESLRNA